MIETFLKKNYYLYTLACILRQWFYSFGGCKVDNNGCAHISKHIIGGKNFIYIGENTIVKNLDIFINGSNNKINISENCIIGRNCSVRIEGNDSTVEIGKGTTMTRDIHICAQENNMKIEIGEDCMFSNNIIIRTSDSHPIYKNGQRINCPQSVKIGNHVWIAPESTVLKGVTIEDGVIVGSKSLVTKNIRTNCLCAGIPAVVIKENIIWTREQLF